MQAAILVIFVFNGEAVQKSIINRSYYSTVCLFQAFFSSAFN